MYSWYELCPKLINDIISVLLTPNIDCMILTAGLPSLEPELRPLMHSLEEQFEIRSIGTAMENGTSRFVYNDVYITS